MMEELDGNLLHYTSKGKWVSRKGVMKNGFLILYNRDTDKKVSHVFIPQTQGINYLGEIADNVGGFQFDIIIDKDKNWLFSLRTTTSFEASKWMDAVKLHVGTTIKSIDNDIILPPSATKMYPTNDSNNFKHNNDENNKNNSNDRDVILHEKQIIKQVEEAALKAEKEAVRLRLEASRLELEAQEHERQLRIAAEKKREETEKARIKAELNSKIEEKEKVCMQLQQEAKSVELETQKLKILLQNQDENKIKQEALAIALAAKQKADEEYAKLMLKVPNNSNNKWNLKNISKIVIGISLILFTIILLILRPFSINESIIAIQPQKESLTSAPPSIIASKKVNNLVNVDKPVVNHFKDLANYDITITENFDNYKVFNKSIPSMISEAIIKTLFLPIRLIKGFLRNIFK